MSVKVTVTPIISIINIPGDTAPIGDPLWLPSVFNGVEIEFDLKFSYVEEPDTAPILSVELSSITPAVEGLVFINVGTDTVKIKGVPVNVFLDEIFRFLFDDKSERELAPTNIEDWITIIKWAAPGVKEKTVAYNFTVTYGNNPTATVPITGATVTVSLFQNVAWKFDPSLAYFQDLVNRGKV